MIYTEVRLNIQEFCRSISLNLCLFRLHDTQKTSCIDKIKMEISAKIEVPCTVNPQLILLLVLKPDHSNVQTFLVLTLKHLGYSRVRLPFVTPASLDHSLSFWSFS